MSALLESILAGAVCQMCELEKDIEPWQIIICFSIAGQLNLRFVQSKKRQWIPGCIKHTVKALKMLSNETRYFET